MLFGPLIHWLVRKIFDGVEDEEKKRRQIFLFDICFTTIGSLGTFVIIIIYGELASIGFAVTADYSKAAIGFHKKLT